MNSILTLTDPPVASGSQREIYMHPHEPARLVKVLRPLALTKGRSKLATFTELHIPALRTRWVRKEYKEFMRLMLGKWDDEVHAPISHLFGFVSTNRGIACISDAVVEDGALGATLAAKAKSGVLDEHDLSLFNETIARIYRYDIRASDMTARNFVFGQRNISGNWGPRECVLVDGFGDIHAIPVRSSGRFFNRFGLDDSCKKLAQRTGLFWDPDQRQFSMKG